MTICIISMFALSACDKAGLPTAGDKVTKLPETSAEGTKSEEVKQTQANAAIYEAVREEETVYAANVTEYNLGQFTYTSGAGKKMPYDLRGILGVPEGEGPFPLVLITHGSHANQDEMARFDTGFTYLVEALAKQGYVAVSMDMQKPYVWKYGDNDDKEKSIYVANEQINFLKAAASGVTETPYPVDLTGKIDFNLMSLIGHSKGGDTVIDIALDQEKKGQSISSILCLAPSVSSDIDTKEWPDSNVSILVPEYDGDVVSLDGYMIQEILDSNKHKLHAVTTLLGANHNFFNTNLTKNDAELLSNKDVLQNQLKPEEQQQFFVSYTLDFLKASIRNHTENTIYQFNTMHPDKMYGFPVTGRVSNANTVQVVDLFDTQGLTANGVNSELTMDSWFYEIDKVLLDTVTFGREKFRNKQLLGISWDEMGASLEIKTSNPDFSSYEALIIEGVTNAADNRNEQGSSQKFSVSLKDKKGNTTDVTLPDNLNALRAISGTVDSTQLDSKVLEFYSVLTPMNEIRLPLSLFEGVDLANIDSITLKFDQTKKGSIYLQNIQLIKS